ncbi:hypothetical protein J1N35_045063 [Gossypium stocksii]|uniref:ELMO domain-containing protein n=1 Tax=Gossypium stocksii TaxID=47602 RepID=A0A9D3UAF5_9ROSI|nr:hypothetical protein J1N35_045063 [Gossypium stocksii]
MVKKKHFFCNFITIMLFGPMPTNFRGGGFISLENLLFFATNFPNSFKDLLWKLEGDRSVWEYPFVVAGVNITFMLI